MQSILAKKKCLQSASAEPDVDGVLKNQCPLLGVAFIQRKNACFCATRNTVKRFLDLSRKLMNRPFSVWIKRWRGAF